MTLGAIAVFLSFRAGETRYIYPDHLTQIRMDVLSNHIRRHAEHGEPIPENLASIATQWELSKWGIQDGWSNEMRLTEETREDWAGYGIRSAGKDKQFDTGDDLVIAIPIPQKESEEGT